VRIKCNRRSKIQKQANIVSAIFAVAFTALSSIHLLNLYAVDDEPSSPYTFTQKARVFDGENWNDIELDEDENYSYYLAGSPHIVEFILSFTINETVPDTRIDIRNILPEGMEYIEEDRVKINITSVSFLFDLEQPIDSNNRNLHFVYPGPAPGTTGEPLEPGNSATFTFRARFLFNNSDSCQSVTNTATAFMQFSEDDFFRTETHIDFNSPCTGLPPLPDPDPDPTPTPNPLPDPNTPKTGALQKQNLPIE